MADSHSLERKGDFRGLLAEARQTLRIGSPIIAAQLLQISMGFVDTIMAGNLSAADLAAVSVGNALLHPVYIFVLGVVMAVTPIVAHNNGAGEFEEIGRNVRQGLWLSQILAVPFILLLTAMPMLMVWMDIREPIIPLAAGYLQALSWGVPPVLAYFALRFFNEGVSATKPGMYFAFLGVLFNIAGNYVFMYGHLGFPAMGAVGTGWATTVVWWVMFGGMFWFTFRHRPYARFGIFTRLRAPSWPHFREILRIGLPNGVSVFMEVGMFAVITLVIGSLGVSTVAGHAVALNFASITFMIALGVSIATTTRVGFAMGRGAPDDAARAGFVGLVLCILFMSIAAAAMLTIPEIIAGIYTADVVVRAEAVHLLFFAAIFQISDGLQVGGLGALRGLKDTRVPMWVNIAAYWGLGVSSGYVLGIWFEMGSGGLWIGLILGLTAAAVAHNIRFVHLVRHPGFRTTGAKTEGAG